MNYTKYIESRPDIMLGKPVIKGTRITVKLIIQKLSEGATHEELIKAYPSLTTKNIFIALAYASHKID